MKLTKLEHACLILDNGESRLIVDPGSFTNLPENLSGISVIVVTEEHLDHFNLDNIARILQGSPDAKLIATEAVATKLHESGYACDAVSGSAKYDIGGYSIKLNEGDHAVIYGSSPCRVLTLLVDQFLYYPSDSFITTDVKVQVLALPTSGPWHKLSESVDFANQIASEQILVTHNGLYNDIGNKVTNGFTSNNIVLKERDYIFLNVGESRSF